VQVHIKGRDNETSLTLDHQFIEDDVDWTLFTTGANDAAVVGSSVYLGAITNPQQSRVRPGDELVLDDGTYVISQVTSDHVQLTDAPGVGASSWKLVRRVRPISMSAPGVAAPSQVYYEALVERVTPTDAAEQNLVSAAYSRTLAEDVTVTDAVVDPPDVVGPFMGVVAAYSPSSHDQYGDIAYIARPDFSMLGFQQITPLTDPTVMSVTGIAYDSTQWWLTTMGISGVVAPTIASGHPGGAWTIAKGTVPTVPATGYGSIFWTGSDFILSSDSALTSKLYKTSDPFNPGASVFTASGGGCWRFARSGSTIMVGSQSTTGALIYRSSDLGATWSAVTPAGGHGWITDISVGNGVWIATLYDGVAGGGYYRSTDNGDSWTYTANWADNLGSPYIPESLLFDGTQFVVVSVTKGSLLGPRIAWSVDGTFWTWLPAFWFAVNGTIPSSATGRFIVYNGNHYFCPSIEGATSNILAGPDLNDTNWGIAAAAHTGDASKQLSAFYAAAI
jgi:hypothetical protein